MKPCRGNAAQEGADQYYSLERAMQAFELKGLAVLREATHDSKAILCWNDKVSGVVAVATFFKHLCAKR